MSLTAAIRHSLNPTRLIRRYTSSRARDPTAVAPDRMRALVELYHQTESFITHENLSKRIDDAFLGTTDSPVLSTYSDETRRMLERKMRDKQRKPRLAGVELDNAYSPGQEWSSSERSRSGALRAALEGSSETFSSLPGLAMLEEESERIQGSIQEDKEMEDAE